METKSTDRFETKLQIEVNVACDFHSEPLTLKREIIHQRKKKVTRTKTKTTM